MRAQPFKERSLVQSYLPEIDGVLCTGCGDCLAACGPHALALAGGKAVLARPDLCEYEGGCEPACPVGAIGLPYLVLFDPVNPANTAFRDRSPDG
jgi:NAD-dependent dihydropyrimidine dehydrogenase PreA subunit